MIVPTNTTVVFILLMMEITCPRIASEQQEEWTSGRVDNGRSGQQEEWIVDILKYGQHELELQGYKEDKERTARRNKPKNNMTLV